MAIKKSKKGKKNLKLGKSVNDVGWGMFTTFLKYKLEDQGKQLYKIDKYFPSSKLCSNCGVINNDLTLDQRVWKCDCGVTHDRDHNAAKNIYNVGKLTVGTTGIAQGTLEQ